MKASNPYHKTGNFGHGEMSWNEYPEFQAWEEGKQAGIKEVVEFLMDNCYVQNTKETNAWQSKLKEWGIE